MSGVLDALRAALGDRVDTSPGSLDAHRHDYWMLAHIRDRAGRGAPRPLAVLRPRSSRDVAAALRVCTELGLPLVPFGGASGVCGAIEAGSGSVVLSTRGLTGLVELDELDMVARFRAGTLGSEAESIVSERGLTIGHWPQSIALSTVGGWVATRAAGQLSTLHGNVEDLILDLEVVLADGQVLRTRDTPRAAAGPDLRQLFLGSEGTLGIVTEVGFSLRPLPECSTGQTFHFSSFGAGIEATRRVLRAGWRPAVVRLYDRDESARQFGDTCPAGRAILLLLHEGPETLVAAQRAGVVEIASASGGVDSGPGPVVDWLEHRNQVPSWDDLLERGLVVDTIEVATTWSRVERLYDAVTTALRGIPGVLLATAHTSHAYRSGTNLYFTFVARPGDPADSEGLYQALWGAAMRATIESRGGIAHHHGIGRVRQGHLEAELGATGVSLLRRLKATLDPGGLLNPGALLP